MDAWTLYIFKKYIYILVQTFTNLSKDKNLEETLRPVSQPAYMLKGLEQR